MLEDHKTDKPARITYYLMHIINIIMIFSPFDRPFVLSMTNLTLSHCEVGCQEKELLKLAI